VSDRLTVEELLPVADALVEALQPIVAKLVAAELEQQPEQAPSDEPYLTVVQYAERVHTTPAAVRARIRRGALADAFKPPGSREWLIPNDDKQGVTAATMPTANSAPATRQRPGA
jgi:hypothetical protein